jgi:hypothetical protein
MRGEHNHVTYKYANNNISQAEEGGKWRQDGTTAGMVVGLERTEFWAHTSVFLLWILGQNPYSRWFYTIKKPEKIFMFFYHTLVLF